MGIDNPVHLIFIAAVALIVLGPKRLPDLARSLGHGMREFRESMSEAVKDDGSVTGTLIPDQTQLVAAPESVTPPPADAVVVDPAAPQPAVVPVQQSVSTQPPASTQVLPDPAVAAPEPVAPPASPPAT
ncbi:MAG TPA: twin-arginine translocase TatA/TatE family subunit [Solirubrobacteraceae bacterium]|jgi:TatA/E family protein of Tat protein translocase